MILQLTQDNLQEIVTQNEKVIALFGNKIDPFFEGLSSENQSVKFVYVDAKKYPKSKRMALVKSNPTFATFKSGKIVAQVGSPQNETLKRMLSEL